MADGDKQKSDFWDDTQKPSGEFWEEQERNAQPAVAVAEAPPPPEKPGFFKRLGQSVGLPTSEKELEGLKPDAATMALGPIVPATRGLIQFGKNVYEGTKQGLGEVGEAARNIQEGGPVLPNLGKAGYGFVESELSRLPFVGEPAKTVGQDVAEKNYAGAAGGATGIAAQVLAPKAIEKLGGVINPTAEDVTGNLMKVQKPSIKQTGYAEKVTNAVPDLQQIAADNKGQIQTPRDAVDAIENHIGKLEQPMSDAAKAMHSAGNTIDVQKPVSSAIDRAFDEKAGAYKPSEVAHAKANLEDYISGHKSLFELENLRRRLNNEASAYYKMSPAERAASGISDAYMTAARAAADQLRTELYGDGKNAGAFENAGMQGDVRGLRQRVGNLLEIRDTLQKAITRAENTGDFSLMREAFTRNPRGMIGSGGIGALLGFAAGGPIGAIAGGTLGEFGNALKAYSESANPNLNVQKAFGKLTRMGEPNLPQVEFKPPQQIPRVAGTQQPLPMPNGPLFQMGQTPATPPPAPPPPIVGEQLPLEMGGQGSLFQMGQTAAPRSIGPLSSAPSRTMLPERSSAPITLPPTSAETIAREAGGQFMGWQESGPGKPRVALFRDPKTGSTLGVRENELSPAAVAKKIAESRKLFGGLTR